MCHGKHVGDRHGNGCRCAYPSRRETTTATTAATTCSRMGGHLDRPRVVGIASLGDSCAAGSRCGRFRDTSWTSSWSGAQTDVATKLMRR